MHPRWPFPALATEAGQEVLCVSDGTSFLLGVACLSQQPSFIILDPGSSWAIDISHVAMTEPVVPRIPEEWNRTPSPTGLRLGHLVRLWNAIRSHECPGPLDVLALVCPQVVFVQVLPELLTELLDQVCQLSCSLRLLLQELIAKA